MSMCRVFSCVVVISKEKVKWEMCIKMMYDISLFKNALQYQMANFNSAKTAVTLAPPSISLSYLLPHRILVVVCPRLCRTITLRFLVVVYVWFASSLMCQPWKRSKSLRSLCQFFQVHCCWHMRSKLPLPVGINSVAKVWVFSDFRHLCFD